MAKDGDEVMALERRFWESLRDEDADGAIALLDDTAVMVSPHGSMQFDHEQYRHMAEHGTMVVRSYELSDMQALFPDDDLAVLTYKVKQSLSPRGKSETIDQEMADSSVWRRKGGKWVCVMHTETPVGR